MAKIIPFKGLRPPPSLASQVATLPYDVCSVEEARQFKDNPYHFYHVTRSEIDLSRTVDVHSPEVYERAAENLNDMIEKGILVQDKEPCYYLYQLVMNGRSQTGLVCGSSIDDYNNGIIKKHEYTRPEKELDRINHIKATHAQTGVVFLAYNNVAAMDRFVADWKQEHAPEYDFTAEDGIRHTLWVISDYSKVSIITDLFADDVPATYIADGHHRAASAARVAEEFREQGLRISGDESFNYFITCIFPADQLEILDYNRVVKDLNGMNAGTFLAALGKDFTVSEKGKAPYKPQQPHEFGLYINGTWYLLTAREGSFNTDPIGVLDVSILQQNVLSKLLNINDPRTDKRVEFVGGIRGLAELEKRVDSGEMAAAFACYPVSIRQLFEVADSGNVMPPKSTWFEPKTRDGLVVYMI
ncbi:DUF1015 domain-containing protein [Taibaiella koreensis]|uniref:DUF1015 domain-containing protein n=1 Tax=Taibaiella koreensis TaxID=1268548 RepID=UPI000E59C458|nr:DUF1015 family protein [Taibaiella koreensis]